MEYSLPVYVIFIYLLYKMECFIRISTTEKNCITTVKNHDNYSGVFEIAKSAGDTSLALFSTMNQRQRVLFLKRELSRLLLVSKMFI